MLDVCYYGCDYMPREWMEWGEDEGPLTGMTAHQATEERCATWPTLVYFGPPLAKPISSMAPLLYGGEGGYVYHLLDHWGRVLYVGKSKQPHIRVLDHRCKPWWMEVHAVRIFSHAEWHEMEKDNIRTLNPRYNVARV